MTENNLPNGIEEEIDTLPYEPVKERKVIIQPYDYAIRTLMDMIIEEELILDPDYQRNYRWDNSKASRFIESIILNIPVPVIYLAEEPDGKFSVIDGQQRLTSLFRFIKANEVKELEAQQDIDQLILEDLQFRADINGKRYVDLSREERSTISKRPIRCIVVLNESDATLKFEVFERLNTGSTSLTDQEVRNCIYRGSFNNIIKEMAKNRKFQELISLPEKSQKTMKDAELVLRFIAYRDLDDGVAYNDNYTEYMNNYMEENREISQNRQEYLLKIFNETIDLIYERLKPGVAFRRPTDMDNPYDGTFASNLINGSIYESQMVGISRLVEQEKDIPDDFRERILSAFQQQDYRSAVHQGTSQKAKALRRSRIVTEKVLA
jgi:hypothetical protein